MRTLDVIEYVVRKPEGVIAQDIAAALAIPVSSLSYLLNTLVERGYLERQGRLYRPGSGLGRLLPTRERLPITERVRPLIRFLLAQSGETSCFFVARGWEVEAVVSEVADHSLRYSIAAGVRSPMHCLAGGKAILAHLSEPELARYFEEAPRKAFTKRTKIDEDALRSELAQIRVDGVASTWEEYTPGICAIAIAAVLDGKPAGSFSVAMPTARFSSDVYQSICAILKSLVSELTS